MLSRARGRVRVVALAAVPLAAAAAVGAVRYAADPAPSAAKVPVATAAPVAAESTGPEDWTTDTAPGSAPTAPSHSATASRSPSHSPSASRSPSGPATRTAHAVQALPAAKLPDAHRSAWKAMGPPQTRQTTHDVNVSECGSVHGAVGWRQQGYAGKANNPAIQDTFTFTSAAAADTAYRKLLTAFGGCRHNLRALQAEHGAPRDAVITKTASITDGTAYSRSWTAVPGISMPGRQTNHYYVVRRGAALTVVQYTQPGVTAPADPHHQDSGDRADLSTIAEHM
ncbi:hypothetical protein [Streptomyces sp. NPDC059597]|uniref:hypothetical protein n=1 Tax=Streptomyces sp. NPDC059597 TaxID=3346879 RepID=UPI003691AA30